MSFAPLEFSDVIRADPKRACAELSARFKAHATIAAVAEELGVSARTVKRWLVTLGEAGHPVSVRARRGWPRGRPRGPEIARNFRGKKAKKKK
jgi:predicted ArsR family transcriptional regulator